jgi:hypothetical protein
LWRCIGEPVLRGGSADGRADLPAAAAIDSLAVVPRLERGVGGDGSWVGWLHSDAADPA